MRRLIREGNPPSGQLASPVPQYWNPSTEAFEDVLGAHGAPRAILYGPNGQPISDSNRLPVADDTVVQALAQLATEGKLEEARALLATIAGTDFATQTTLAQVLSRLDDIEQRFESGDAKVQLKGSAPLPVAGLDDLSDDVKRLAPTELVVDYWSGEYPESGTLTLFDSGPGHGVVLDSLQVMSSVSNRPTLRLLVYNANGTSTDLRYIANNGVVSRDIRPDYIGQGRSDDLFAMLTYESGEYVFELRKPQAFPHGMRMYFLGGSGGPTVRAIWRVLR